MATRRPHKQSHERILRDIVCRAADRTVDQDHQAFGLAVARATWRAAFREVYRRLVDSASKPRNRPRRVIVESPYAGATAADVADNVAYARRAILDSLRRGEAPLASHLLYTQVLDNSIPEDRRLGIAAGLAWTAAADLVAVYIDCGVSSGMEAGIEAARRAGVRVEERRIGK